MNDLFWFILAWLLSIPTGIIINLISPSIGTYLKNRSNEREIKEILTHYADMVMRRKELYYSGRRPIPPITLSYMLSKSVNIKVLILIMVIMLVQALSSSAFTDMYGEKASDLYFWITVFIVGILNAGAIAYGNKDDKIFLDAVHFKKYREKTKIKLIQLGYGSGVLTKIDREFGTE